VKSELHKIKIIIFQINFSTVGYMFVCEGRHLHLAVNEGRCCRKREWLLERKAES